jgi:hypothetical protein
VAIQRHILAFQPIVDLSIVKSINALLAATPDTYREGPGSISPFVYWWRAGALHVLAGAGDGENATFTPPPAFAEVLRQLPQP